MAQPSSSTAAQKPEHLLLRGAALLALVIVAYIPALSAGFIWDDDAYVTENALLTAPDGLWRIWFSTHTQSQYFPMVYTTLRMEHALWGLNPVGYHAVNILLHGANVLLVWGLLRRMEVPGAWLAAAIFGLHPVHVESVAWVTELKNTESTLFYLLAIVAWLRFWAPRSTAQRWAWYALALALHAMALCSKTTACTLPAALLLVLWLQRKPITGKTIGLITPFILLGLGMGLLSIWWERHLGNYDPVLQYSFSLLERLLIATRALWFYAGKLLWPASLSFSYWRWNVNTAEPSQYLWFAGCLAIAALLWRQRRSLGRGPAAAVLFFVAALSPLLGFIPLYTFRMAFVADHYQYPASIGLIALFAAVAAGPWVTRRISAPVRHSAAVLLLATLGVLTWRQTQTYRDLETLWRSTLASNPQSWLAQLGMGSCLAGKGQFDEAESYFRRALEIAPSEYAHSDLGWSLARAGKLEEALPHFHAAIRIRQSYPKPHYFLGVTLDQLGRTREAMEQYREALRYEPLLSLAMNNLAWRLATHPDASIRNGPEAVRLAEKACEITGSQVPVFLGTLAAAYAEAGRFDDAVAASDKARALALSAGEQGLAEKNELLCQNYRAGKPWREDPAAPR